MAIDRPPLYSVWENRAGEKIFVDNDLDADGLTGEDFEREATVMRAMFVLTYVAYESRGNLEVTRFETDEGRCAQLTGSEGFRMTGIEPVPSIIQQVPKHG